MQFARVLSFFFAFMSFGMFAFAAPGAAPAPVAKRDDLVLTVGATLEATVDPIIVEINALIDADGLTAVALSPLVVALAAAIDVCVTALVEVKGDSVDIDVAAALYAKVIADVAVCLDAVVAVDASLVSITSLCDLPFYNLLVNLNLCIEGIIAVIAGLCASVKVDIQICLWVKVLALLGL